MARCPSVPFDYRKVDVWVNGLEEDNEPSVYLRVDLSTAEIEFSAAHELHHVWFERQPGHDNPKRETLRENAADAFAFQAMADLRKKGEEAEEIREVAGLHAASQDSWPRWQKGPDGKWKRL